MATAIVTLGLAAAPAAAHTRLLSSTPVVGSTVSAGAPMSTTLRFSDNILDLGVGVALTKEKGRTIRARPHVEGNMVTATFPALTPGAYRIGYRVVSADGHPITGRIPFAVSATTGSPTLPQGASHDTPAEPGPPASGHTDPSASARIGLTISAIIVVLIVVVFGYRSWRQQPRKPDSE